MLTREQAKTKECPLRAAGWWANPNENMSASDGSLNCRAENCPKWVDIEMPCNHRFGNGKGTSWHCEHVRHGGDMDICMDGHQTFCPECIRRYGRCGG